LVPLKEVWALGIVPPVKKASVFRLAFIFDKYNGYCSIEREDFGKYSGYLSGFEIEDDQYGDARPSET